MTQPYSVYQYFSQLILVYSKNRLVIYNRISFLIILIQEHKQAQILLMRLEVCINEQDGTDQCAVIIIKPNLNFLNQYFACIFECANFLLCAVNRHRNCTGTCVFLSQKYRQFYSLNRAVLSSKQLHKLISFVDFPGTHLSCFSPLQKRS